MLNDPSPTPPIPALALRPREAAKAIGICPRTLWGLTASGKIPHVRLSKKMVLYPVDSLRKWLADQAAGGER